MPAWNRPSEASRISVIVVLRVSTSISPVCSAVKRCAAVIGTYLVLLGSPSAAAAMPLHKSTSMPDQAPRASGIEKPATPVLTPQVTTPFDLIASKVAPAWAPPASSAPPAASAAAIESVLSMSSSVSGRWPAVSAAAYGSLRGETSPSCAATQSLNVYGCNGRVLHQRHAFRPRWRARPVRPPVRLGARHGRGLDRALERDGWPRRRRLASRRLRARAGDRARRRAARRARRRKTSDRRQQRSGLGARAARLDLGRRLRRARARRRAAGAVPLPVPVVERHEQGRAQPARPQPRQDGAAAAPDRRRGRRLGFRPGGARAAPARKTPPANQTGNQPANQTGTARGRTTLSLPVYGATRADAELVVLHGNCQIPYLAALLSQADAEPGARGYACVLNHAPPGQAIPAPSAAQMRRCRLYLEQHDSDDDPPVRAQVRAMLPPGCPTLVFPPLWMTCLWPFMAPQPADRRLVAPDAPFGRFPIGDRIGLAVARTGLSGAAAFEADMRL